MSRRRSAYHGAAAGPQCPGASEGALIAAATSPSRASPPTHTMHPYMPYPGRHTRSAGPVY